MVLSKSHDSVRSKGVFKRVIETPNKYPNKNFVSLTSLSRCNVTDIEPMCAYFSGSHLFDGMMFHFQYLYSGLGDIALDKDERKKAAENMMNLKRNILNC